MATKQEIRAALELVYTAISDSNRNMADNGYSEEVDAMSARDAAADICEYDEDFEGLNPQILSGFIKVLRVNGGVTNDVEDE